MRLKIMGLFDKKTKIKPIKPGESRELGMQIPKNAERIVIRVYYDDEFKNKYVTDITLDLKNKKVVSQEYRCVKKVKDFGDEIPKLVIDEKSINWQNMDKN